MSEAKQSKGLTARLGRLVRVAAGVAAFRVLSRRNSPPASQEGDGAKPGTTPHSEPQAEFEPNHQGGHESRDVTLGAAAVFAVVIAGLVGFALLGVGGMTRFLNQATAERATPALPLAATAPAPARFNLEVQPVQLMQSYRATSEAKLNASGWVDQQAGIVRIPITEAMQLLVEQGLPTAIPGGAAGQATPSLTVTGTPAAAPAVTPAATVGGGG